jgi:hypothetical protein
MHVSPLLCSPSYRNDLTFFLQDLRAWSLKWQERLLVELADSRELARSLLYAEWSSVGGDREIRQRASSRNVHTSCRVTTSSAWAGNCLHLSLLPVLSAPFTGVCGYEGTSRGGNSGSKTKRYISQLLQAEKGLIDHGVYNI